MNALVRSIVLFALAHMACGPGALGSEALELVYRTGKGEMLTPQHVRSRTREFLHPRHLRNFGYRELPAPRIEEVRSLVLYLPDGSPFAAIDETCRWIDGSGIQGVLRRLEVTPFDLQSVLVIEVPGMQDAVFGGTSSGPPSPFDDTLEGAGGRNSWAVCDGEGASAQVMVWSRPPGIAHDEGSLRVSLDAPRDFELAVVSAKRWDAGVEETLLVSLEEETDR